MRATFALAFLLGGVGAELKACLESLSLLMSAPYNVSLPFMNGVSGRINVAYLYQQPMLSVLPNEVLGSFDLCNNADMYIPGIIDTHYCILGRDRGGVCVPKQCTAADLMDRKLLMPLMNLGIAAAPEVPFNCILDPFLTQSCAWQRQAWEYYQGLYNMIALFAQDTPLTKGVASCAVEPPGPNGSSYAMMFFIVLFTAFALAGAGWGSMRSAFVAAEKARARLAAKQQQQQIEMASTSQNKSPVATTGAMVDIPLEETKNEAVGNKAKPAGFAQQPYFTMPACPPWLKAFSLTDNWKEIFTLRTRPGEFAIFDAMKAISAAWVVFYHVILWETSFLDNPEYLIPPKGLLSKWWAVPFFNYSGTLSVDTFFFISAFLATYFLMVKLDKEAAKPQPATKWVPMLYVHRWLRITPAYMFSFFLHWKIAPLLAYGPISKGVWATSTRPCEKTWWAHFLYINDLYPWYNQRYGQICYGHSWYLANDMQYFLLVPLFVMLYRSGRPKLAVYSVLACLLTCIIASWALTVEKDWSPDSWDGAAGTRYTEQGFPRPWIRCASYMIGILFAFLWHNKKTKNPDYKYSKSAVNVMWWSSMFLLAISMYGPYSGSQGVIPCNLPIAGRKQCGSGWSAGTRGAIIALLRPTWTLGLALLCLLCWNNQGGLIQKFLSHPAWAPLSTLSFTVYLVHYTVLTFYIGNRATRVRFDLFNFLSTFIGLTAISTALALMVVLLVEKPFMKLTKIYLEQGSSSGKSKAVSGTAGSTQQQKQEVQQQQVPGVPPKSGVRR